MNLKYEATELADGYQLVLNGNEKYLDSTVVEFI
jgi:hypothetical protein